MTLMGTIVLHPVHMLEPGAQDPNNMGLTWGYFWRQEPGRDDYIEIRLLEWPSFILTAVFAHRDLES